ncbi:hypothetical protein F511_21046 [Dorcoceras hygrometricum]|uniref:Uncharacterized protein n=1 Tax=Dorcoceras hygrometricum TaxID=472368 RepID=A0A2Z7CSL7_9LAMI|nr:hypothetical protein F511_21046 [Dorcoceras hygrometricum]
MLCSEICYPVYVYVYVVCSNDISHLLSVSPNTYPSVLRTRAAAALRMKKIALDNQSRMIRFLRVLLATERRGLATIKKEHERTQVALEASHKTIVGLTEIGLCMSRKIERMKAKKRHARESHLECHHKWQARIQEAEDSLQAQHLIIEALVEEKDSLLQTIQGLQEANDAPAPFEDDGRKNRKKTRKKKSSKIFLWARERLMMNRICFTF